MSSEGRNHFSKLSFEVLSKIFDHSLLHFQPDGLEYDFPPDPGAFRKWTPLHLAGVCKQWNEIVMTNSLLWAEWCIVVQDDNDVLDDLSRKIKKLAALSKGCPITVQLFLRLTKPSWDDVQIFKYRRGWEDIRSHSNRIHTLFLWGYEPLFSSLPVLVLPALKRLEVYNAQRCGDPWYNTTSRLDPLQIDAPKLTHLILSATNLVHFNSQLETLRTLTFQFDFDEVSLCILNRTPNLERLGIYDILVEECLIFNWLDSLPPEINLPRLRVLDWLQTSSGPELGPKNLLNKLSTPCLEHFRWHCQDQGFGNKPFPAPHEFLNSISSLKSFLFRTSCNVEELVLDAWTLSSQLLVVCYDKHWSYDGDPIPYPWYPEDLGDRLLSHIFQDAEWKRFQVRYVLPPIPLLSP